MWLTLLPAVFLTLALAAAAPAGAAPNAAFVGNYSASTISQYTFGAGGSLVPNGKVNSGSEPWFLEITPNARFLYATDYNSTTVDQFGINSSGTLTPLSPSQVTAGRAPIGLAISPDGHNAYVANDGSASVSVYDVGSGGTLTLIQTLTADLSEPNSVAVSPDGHSVYVGDGRNDTIVEYDRAAAGTLSLKSIPTIAAPDGGYSSVSITPDGKNVYSTGTSSSTIGEYTVGTNGELSVKPITNIPTGISVYQLDISPNGRNVYGASCEDGNVYQYSIATDGELSAMTPPTVPAGSCPEFVWMSANGSSAYVPNFSDADVSQYDVSSTGALSPKSTPTVPAGAGAGDIMIPPDQGPVASFTAAAKHAGQTTTFNGSGSSDSDGTVARYDWSFGDGTSAANGGATPSHTYKKAGTYTVTLTVTDDSGCSMTQVFTGQTAYCNGTPAAQTTRTVKITSATKPLRVTASPQRAQAGKRTCFAFKVTSRGKAVSKAKLRFAGHTTHTSKKGRATLCVALKKGSYTARATKHGYKAATARVTITAAPKRRTSPGFTG